MIRLFRKKPKTVVVDYMVKYKLEEYELKVSDYCLLYELRDVLKSRLEARGGSGGILHFVYAEYNFCVVERWAPFSGYALLFSNKDLIRERELKEDECLKAKAKKLFGNL